MTRSPLLVMSPRISTTRWFTMLSAACIWTLLRSRLLRYCFASAVRTGGGGGGGFGPKVSQPNAPRIRIMASAMTMLAGEILTSGNGHFSEHNGRRGYRAEKLEIVADFGDTIQHFLHRAGDGHLRHGECEFSIADPDADGAARIIARDSIDTAANQFGHIKSIFNAAENFFRRATAGFEEEIAVADAGVAGNAA